MIYLVAIPFTQVFPASWFGHITSPNCWWNSSWDFTSVEIQWQAGGSFSHAKWGWMAPGTDKRSKANQVTSPIFSAKNWHISGYLWFFSAPSQAETSFSLPLKKSYIVLILDSISQLTSITSVKLFAGSLPGGPSFMQPISGTAG